MQIKSSFLNLFSEWIVFANFFETNLILSSKKAIKKSERARSLH